MLQNGNIESQLRHFKASEIQFNSEWSWNSLFLVCSAIDFCCVDSPVYSRCTVHMSSVSILKRIKTLTLFIELQLSNPLITGSTLHMVTWIRWPKQNSSVMSAFGWLSQNSLPCFSCPSLFLCFNFSLGKKTVLYSLHSKDTCMLWFKFFFGLIFCFLCLRLW